MGTYADTSKCDCLPLFFMLIHFYCRTHGQTDLSTEDLSAVGSFVAKLVAPKTLHVYSKRCRGYHGMSRRSRKLEKIGMRCRRTRTKSRWQQQRNPPQRKGDPLLSGWSEAGLLALFLSKRYERGLTGKQTTTSVTASIGLYFSRALRSIGFLNGPVLETA